MNREQYFSVLIDDKLVSFNIERTLWGKTSQRRVILSSYPDLVKRIIIPGVKIKTEKKLLRELYQYQSQRRVNETSFSIPPQMFSLLWRFAVSRNFVKKKIGGFNHFTPLDTKTKKKLRKTIAGYNRKLAAAINPGVVFLFPDREVNFNDPHRFKHPYARKVLIASCTEEQLTIIPFTTRIKRLNNSTDILFDSTFQKADLRPEARPAIETFPYRIFTKPVVLKIGMAQTISRRYFIATGLQAKGRISNQLLELVQQRRALGKMNN